MTAPFEALTPFDAPPYPARIIAGQTKSGVLILCDHASNMIPSEYRDLGLPRSELERHIGYDIGAAAMAEALADALFAPAVLSGFSRLLIDPNRGEDDPTLVMRLSDGAVVPGNARIDDDEIARRIRRFYIPYDAAIRAALDTFRKDHIRPVIISLHSFTPIWRGAPRPWHAGILWAKDGRLSKALIDALRSDPALIVGDNEPYHGALSGDVIDRHALAHGYSNTLIEIRQDLIATDETARAWGKKLAQVLAPLIADPIHRLDFRSSTGS